MRFLRSLLELMGVPIDDFWSTEEEVKLSVDQKIKLRDILTKYSIQVIDDNDGGMKIYVDKTLVGEFLKSTFKLKRNIEELDPKKQLYLEMTINYNSMFEQ